MRSYKNNTPGLIKQVISILFEQAKRRKAVRQLAKVDWSLEFLSEVLRYAAIDMHKNVTIVIESKSGNKIYLNSVTDCTNKLAADDDIFNHLDDRAAVEAFIRDHARG